MYCVLLLQTAKIQTNERSLFNFTLIKKMFLINIILLPEINNYLIAFIFQTWRHNILIFHKLIQIVSQFVDSFFLNRDLTNG